VRAFTIAVFAFITLAACSRGVGSKCKGNESMCTEKRAALSCQDGKFVQVACNGPLGCVRMTERASCDDSIAEEGAPCMASGDEEYACTADKKRALSCKNKRFERYLECRGRGGCSLLGQQVSCDTSVAAKADPCKAEGSVSCSEDMKQLIICRDGRFESYRYCRGQYGCHFRGDTPTCDETLSAEGDPCGLPGYVVCSVDGKDELVCQGSSFLRSRTCRKGCQVTNRPGRPIECD
jgi:hypothetical protein